MEKMNSKQDANFANSSEDSMKGEGIKTHYIALPHQVSSLNHRQGRLPTEAETSLE